MKNSITTHSGWAESIIARLNTALTRMSAIGVDMWKYDTAPRWKRLLMGGRIYRAWLQEKYDAALDTYMALDLQVKD